jgi:hypothetical protein
MHTTAAVASRLSKAVADGAGREETVSVAVCPPLPYLAPVGAILKGSRVALGAQNHNPEKEGAFIGEVSPTPYGKGARRATRCGRGRPFDKHPFATDRRLRADLSDRRSRASRPPDLTEWDYGEYECQLTTDVRRTRPGWYLFRDGWPGGQSVAVVSARANRALPLSALVHLGENTILQVGKRSFCWMSEDSHATWTEVETGVSDGEWIEVTNPRAPRSDARAAGKDSGTRFTGTERIILGNLLNLTEGGALKVTTTSDAAKVALAYEHDKLH